MTFARAQKTYGNQSTLGWEVPPEVDMLRQHTSAVKYQACCTVQVQAHRLCYHQTQRLRLTAAKDITAVLAVSIEAQCTSMT